MLRVDKRDRLPARTLRGSHRLSNAAPLNALMNLYTARGHGDLEGEAPISKASLQERLSKLWEGAYNLLQTDRTLFTEARAWLLSTVAGMSMPGDARLSGKSKLSLSTHGTHNASCARHAWHAQLSTGGAPKTTWLSCLRTLLVACCRSNMHSVGCCHVTLLPCAKRVLCLRCTTKQFTRTMLRSVFALPARAAFPEPEPRDSAAAGAAGL